MSSGPSDVLTRVLHLWPSRDDDTSLDVLRSRMAGLLAERFFDGDLCLQPIGRFEVDSRPVQMGNMAKIFVRDTGYRGSCGTLAVLVREGDGEWRLYALLLECLVCFGSQLVADDFPCDYCGATGWGEWKEWEKRSVTIW